MTATDLPSLPPGEIEEAPAPPPVPRNLKIAAVFAVFFVLGLAHHFGVLARLREPAELARSLVALGAWGYLAFIVAYALLQPFGVPGTVFVIAAPLIWPWPVAFVLSMTGTMAATSIGFLFARLVARDWISRRIPARFKKYDRALAERAFVTVFVLRFVFWMPPLLHAFFGVSKVRFGTHFWASFLGYLLPLFVCSYFGEKIFTLARSAPPSVWISMAAGAAAIAFAVWAWRRKRAVISARAS